MIDAILKSFKFYPVSLNEILGSNGIEPESNFRILNPVSRLNRAIHGYGISLLLRSDKSVTLPEFFRKEDRSLFYNNALHA